VNRHSHCAAWRRSCRVAVGGARARVAQAVAHRHGVAEQANIAQRVAFEQRLRELGYIEGQNLVIEYINIPDRPDRIDEAARELVQRNVDVFVLENHIMLKSVMGATSASPIVIIATSFDPRGPRCRSEYRTAGRERHRLLRSPA
jgi:ABC-type uncharacterized transport system substrate-binding protein